MVDFEKIGDTFEEGFDKVKDFTKKNKVLIIAICGVGTFALYKLFTDKRASQDTEYTATYAYVPTGYDGYPIMSESVSYDDVVDQLRTETSDINQSFYDETMSDISQLIDKIQYENNNFESIIEPEENLSHLSGGNKNGSESLSFLEIQRQRDAIREQMKANSEAWHTASPSEKSRLHEENIALASLFGAIFDSVSGNWFKDGETLYDVSIKNKTNSSTAGLTNVGVVETSVNTSDIIAQMKKNSEAWWKASDTEKTKLETENKHLGSLIGASYDSSSGTWNNTSGSPLYTVSSGTTKTSSTSTNVKTGGSKGSTGSKGSDTSSVIAQMQANSKAWHNASDSEKKALESKNQELGKSIGASYDSGSGTWSKDGTKLY